MKAQMYDLFSYYISMLKTIFFYCSMVGLFYCFTIVFFSVFISALSVSVVFS